MTPTPTTETKGELTGAQKAALVRQEIEYSDFPVELSPMKLWLEQSGDQWVLMLPRER